MQRAIDLAKQGSGKVSPNPVVGCVIVKNGLVIGEGFHEKYGSEHAEVNAVSSVKNKDNLEDATVYVTLEPCDHYGKTPPCTDLLIASNVKKVVIAAIDKNPKVNGRGINKLKSAGIEVITGLLTNEYQKVNRRFFTFHEEKRPYVILKWAQTCDGFIAREDYSSKWISNTASRQLVHRWRSEEDAILVGKNTALYDNPSLNVRDWHGVNPTRILIDFDLQVPESFHLFDQKIDTLIINSRVTKQKDNLEWIQVDRNNYQKEVLHLLFERAVQSLIIEGGAKTLQSFIDLGYWDEARIFESDESFGSGIQSPEISGNFLEALDVEGNKLTYLHKTHG